MLVAEWGGTNYAWSDPLILGMGAAGLLTWVLFFLSQTRAAEPIIPLRLFRSRIYRSKTRSASCGSALGIRRSALA